MKARKRQRAMAAVLVLALASTPTSTRAGTWTGGASEWTQIANNIQLVLQYVQQVMMVINLAKQVAMMIKMVATSPSDAGAIVTGFSSILGTAQQFVFTGKSLTEQWKKTHPGEQTPEVKGYGSIEDAYDAIDRDLHAAAQQSLQALDIHISPRSVSQDEQIISKLRQKMESAEGQMQAQQATNELLLEVIRQLSLIRQVNIVQARMVSVGLSDEAQRRLYRSKVVERDYAYRGLYRGMAESATWGRP